MAEGVIRGKSGGGSGATSLANAVITLASNSFVYDGTEKTQAVTSVTLYGDTLTEGRDYIIMDNVETNAGTHTLMVLGIMEYSGAAYASWSIARQQLAKPTVTSSGLTYDGTSKSVELSNDYNSSLMSKDGDVSGTNAGSYTVEVLLNDTTNYEWSDGKIEPLELPWSIGKRSFAKPTITSGSFTYGGDVKTPTTSSDFVAAQMTKGGDTSKTNAGSYVLTVSLNDTANNQWSDSSIAPLELSWSIAKREVTRPSVSATPIPYDGTAKEPSVTGFSSATMEKSGDTSATVVDDYTLTISLIDTDNNKWDNDTTAPIDYPWYISKRTLTKPTITSTHTYNTNSQSPTTDANFISSLMTKGGDTSGTNAGDYTLTVSLNDTANNQWENSASNPISIPWSIAKANGSVSVDPTTLELSGIGSTDTIDVTKNGDGTLSVESSDTGVISATISGNTVTVTVIGNGTANVTVTMADGTNYFGASAVTAVTASTVHIYGVSWPKTSTMALSRTDDSALFTDPVPALSGGTGSSPFDSCLPWSGMVRETVSGNEMVKIPKFYYKWTNESNALKLQIADNPVDGFHTSPAHADRGDGKGERDYVYIGRYHCATSTYKSTTGVKPQASITRATARTNCKNVGTGFSQLDYAMWWTVRMLYLVEFAHWNSQEKIGYGCGNNSSTHNSGASDSAKYHTGSMQSSRTTYGSGIQYRYIEDPWGNVYDWCDGIVLSSRNPYVTNVIANYGDTTTNHTQVGTGPSSNGDISGWNVPTVSGLEWALFPSATVSNSNYNTYCADGVSAGYVVVFVGGVYYQYQNYGVFYSNSGSASSTSSNIGARLQYLP